MFRHASMNRVYRLVWNRSSGAWVPVAEISRGHGRSGRDRSSRASIATVAGGWLLFASSATGVAVAAPAVAPTAAPAGGKVTLGTGTITQSASSTDIHQSTPTLAIDWQSFNIGAQQSVNFLQPSAASVAANRVTGTEGTQILGHLNANGQVFLVNPNGIVFAKGAQVNVGGLVASALDFNPATFKVGSANFSGSGTGAIRNDGSLNAAQGGYIALLGSSVTNLGSISAQLGTVALGAGSAVTLSFTGNSLVGMRVDRSVLASVASNGGLIAAGGGRVLMSAGAQDALLASVVNNSGLIEAQTVANHNGTITLAGGGAQSAVAVSGTLDASAPSAGNGGSIATTAAQVTVADGATLTTAAAHGLTGSWSVSARDVTVAAHGGDMSGATLSKALEKTSVAVAATGSATTAGIGNVNVSDRVTWSAANGLSLTARHDVNINSVVTATNATPHLAIDANHGATSVGTPVGALNFGSAGQINLPNVAPASTSALVINGTAYTVINRLADLQGMQNTLAGSFALGGNIDATPTAGWNGGLGFNPVGNSQSKAFTGKFEGLGHSITNLTINRPNSDGVGLFGWVEPPSRTSEAVIRDVTLSGGRVTGRSDTGALAGLVIGGIIDHVGASVMVTGTDAVGGLVGRTLYGLMYKTTGGGHIDHAFSSGAVTGTSNVGGLVGFEHGLLTASHASGTVTGKDVVGGLVGFLNGDYTVRGSIDGSYATGNVTSAGSAGGLVGQIGGGYGGFVSNSHASGMVSGGVAVGGLVGISDNLTQSSVGYSLTGVVSDSYATGAVTGSSQVGGLMGRNEGVIASSHASGAVVGDDSVGGLVGSNGGSWPGQYNTEGTVGVIKDSFASGTVTGGTRVGGLAGTSGLRTTQYGIGGFYGVVGIITGSHASGAVSATGSMAGGLVGESYGGTVARSSASGSVSGQADVGGLIGRIVPPVFSTAVDASFATGDVSGSINVGGLVGMTTSGAIQNSYATGNVFGRFDVGGLVGYAGISELVCCLNASIVDSYSVGLVSGWGRVGGLVGYADKRVTAVGTTVTVTGSFWDVNTSGRTTSAGGIGMTTSQMQTQANFTSATAANGFVNPGWDFKNIWVIHDGQSYPTLRWSSP